MELTPLPKTKYVHLSLTPPSLCVDVKNGWPQRALAGCKFYQLSVMKTNTKLTQTAVKQGIDPTTEQMSRRADNVPSYGICLKHRDVTLHSMSVISVL